MFFLIMFIFADVLLYRETPPMTASGQTDAEARGYADALQAFVDSGRHTPMTGFVEEGKYIFARRGMLIHCLPKTASDDLDAHIAGLKKTYDEIFDAGRLKPSLPSHAQPYQQKGQDTYFLESEKIDWLTAVTDSGFDDKLDRTIKHYYDHNNIQKSRFFELWVEKLDDVETCLYKDLSSLKTGEKDYDAESLLYPTEMKSRQII